MKTRRLLIGCDFTYVAAIPTPVIFQACSPPHHRA